MTDDDVYWTLIDIANALLTGTFVGGYYAMLAVGLALSFGVMRLVNLAHGDFLIVGAYLSAAIVQILNIPPFLVLFIVAPIMFVIGYAPVSYTHLDVYKRQASTLPIWRRRAARPRRSRRPDRRRRPAPFRSPRSSGGSPV